MKTFYETIKATFAIAVIIALCCTSAQAAEGIDSAEGSDLPLNAQNTLVATLRKVNGEGVLDVNGVLKAQSGAKIGTVADKVCDKNVDSAVALSNKGLIRYNTAKDTMQYCNGKTWKTLYSSIKTQQVFCDATFLGHSNDYGCTATCPAGTTVTGGGVGWSGVYSAAGRHAYMMGNGFRCWINIDRCSSSPPSCGAKCYAICADAE